MEYRELQENEIGKTLFDHFIRHQVVTKCMRKINQTWVEQSTPFIDDWNERDYRILVRCLKRTVKSSGVVFAAFDAGELKGFSSVELTPFGDEREYLDLSSLHVSEDRRGRGIGTRLFALCCTWAKSHGAQKLYISSHSAVETQAFYRTMGCVEAQKYHQKHVDQEPFDCQLERVL